MKSKRFVMASSLGVALILAVVLTFLYRGKLFARYGAGQQHKVDAPAKAGFVDVFPVTFHPVKGQEIALPDGEAMSPRVSPDGARVVCVVRRGGKSSLALAELPSGAISTLAVELDDVADPAWSADGSQIVFAGKHQEVSEIYLYHLKTKKLTQVTRDPARKKSWPRCSPYRFDKQYRIAYASEEKGRKDIWWVRDTGEYDQPITIPAERKDQFAKDKYWENTIGAPPPITAGGETPEWSPSGNVLLYRTGPNSVAALSYTYYDWWHTAKIKIPSSSGVLSWAPNQCGFLEYDPMKQ